MPADTAAASEAEHTAEDKADTVAEAWVPSDFQQIWAYKSMPSPEALLSGVVAIDFVKSFLDIAEVFENTCPDSGNAESQHKSAKNSGKYILSKWVDNTSVISI